VCRQVAVTDDDGNFCTFVREGTRVRLVIRAGRGGGLQAHLDTCNGCRQKSWGFVDEEHEVARQAGLLEYPTADEEWAFSGACAPITIRSDIEGGDLIIDRAVLEKAARYF
jgi:uncharacterized membrane protein